MKTKEQLIPTTTHRFPTVTSKHQQWLNVQNHGNGEGGGSESGSGTGDGEGGGGGGEGGGNA